MSEVRNIIVVIVLWLTRAGGVLFVVFGFGFCVAEWKDKAAGLILMGVIVIAIAFGVVLTSIHAPSPDRLEYRLLPSRIFRRRKRD